jgi:hypothetical protein
MASFQEYLELLKKRFGGTPPISGVQTASGPFMQLQNSPLGMQPEFRTGVLAGIHRSGYHPSWESGYGMTSGSATSYDKFRGKFLDAQGRLDKNEYKQREGGLNSKAFWEAMAEQEPYVDQTTAPPGGFVGESRVQGPVGTGKITPYGVAGGAESLAEYLKRIKKEGGLIA